MIRIFDTDTGDKLQEVRRGADRADIYSIGFSHSSQFICVSSHKGTIHIFSIADSKINSTNNQNSNNSTAASSSGPNDSAKNEIASNRKSKFAIPSPLAFYSSPASSLMQSKKNFFFFFQNLSLGIGSPKLLQFRMELGLVPRPRVSFRMRAPMQ